MRVLTLDIFYFLLFVTSIHSECPDIVTKVQWGGRPNKVVDYLIIPIKNVIIQHTASPECTTAATCTDKVLNIQTYHIDSLNWHDIGYNFIVGGDGNIYEGVGWLRVGAHTYHWNTKSIGIAFIGDFSEKLPNAKAMENVKKLLECGVESGKLDSRYRLFGHRQLIATQSPGTVLYRNLTTWPHFSIDTS